MSHSNKLDRRNHRDLRVNDSVTTDMIVTWPRTKCRRCCNQLPGPPVINIDERMESEFWPSILTVPASASASLSLPPMVVNTHQQRLHWGHQRLCPIVLVHRPHGMDGKRVRFPPPLSNGPVDQVLPGVAHVLLDQLPSPCSRGLGALKDNLVVDLSEARYSV